MTLVTRCPTCGTAFRTQPAQLSARGGKVRCGKCGTIFNGVAGLIEEERSAANREPSPQLALFEAARRAGAGQRAEPALRPAPEPRATQVPRPTPADTSAPAPAAAPSEPVKPDEPSPAQAVDTVPAGAEDVPSPPSPEPAALPEFLAAPAPPRRWTLAWSLAAVLAVIVLALQGLLQYRAEVLARFPGTRPALETLCAALGCRVHLPHRPGLMSIESSDLQADPRRADVIALDAVIRNRAPFAQEYPSLELTLTDDQQRALVRRVLGPSDYLELRNARARLERGIAADTDVEIHVYFDTGSVHPTGYRVYLFYP